MSAPDDPPDKRPLRTRLWDGYFTVVRGAMLAICVLFVVIVLLITALATVDISFGMGWGYQWFVIPIGIGMAIVGTVFFWLADRFARAVAHISK
jgi:hypothetical protein